MDYLDNRGLIAHDTRKNLLGNHLVLIAPADASVTLAIAPHFDLLGALKGGRLSIADPDTVPAGKYARTALTTLGVWNARRQSPGECGERARRAHLCVRAARPRSASSTRPMRWARKRVHRGRHVPGQYPCSRSSIRPRS